MKKTFFAIFLLLILIFPILSAIEFEINSEFKQGETILAKVSGNFQEAILPVNILFYRGHVKVPFDFDVTQINEEFYIYALTTDKTPANYTISIEEVEYRKATQIIDDKIQKNFTILSDVADFSIDPGFALAKENFSIIVQNLQDSKISINVNNEKTETIKSGDIKQLNFETKAFSEESSLNFLELSTDNQNYQIPIYVLAEESVYEKQRYRFSPPELNISLITNENKQALFHIKNYGEPDIANITLSMSRELKPYMNFSVTEINDLESNKSAKILINLFSDKEITVEGYIKAKTSVNLKYLPVTINFLDDYEPLPGQDYIPVTQNTCENDLAGKFCTADEYCENQELIDAFDGKDCCLSECKSLENNDDNEESSTGKIIGWSIVILIIIFLAWFFLKKYKSAKGEINLLDIAKGKNK